MAKEINPNKPNWPGAVQNSLITAIQKGGLLPILLCLVVVSFYGLTPDEQKPGFLKSAESFWICRAGWVVSFFIIMISGTIIFRQHFRHKSEMNRLISERDKNQKQRGIEIESSDE